MDLRVELLVGCGQFGLLRLQRLQPALGVGELLLEFCGFSRCIAGGRELLAQRGFLPGQGLDPGGKRIALGACDNRLLFRGLELAGGFRQTIRRVTSCRHLLGELRLLVGQLFDLSHQPVAFCACLSQLLFCRLVRCDPGVLRRLGGGREVSAKLVALILRRCQFPLQRCDRGG